VAQAKRSTRTGVDRRNRDSEVVAAAVQVFHQKGYAAATIQDVADVVGVLKGSLYHYISSKEDLLFRILTESHAQARELMDQIMEMDATPLERLRTWIDSMYRWYATNVERASVYITQHHNLTGERAEAMRTQAREFEHFLRELLAEAKGAGALRADLDTRMAARFLLGSLNSVPRWYHPGGSTSPEDLAREFTRMSLAAVTAVPSYVDQLLVPPGPVAAVARAARARTQS